MTYWESPWEIASVGQESEQEPQLMQSALITLAILRTLLFFCRTRQIVLNLYFPEKQAEKGFQPVSIDKCTPFFRKCKQSNKLKKFKQE